MLASFGRSFQSLAVLLSLSMLAGCGTQGGGGSGATTTTGGRPGASEGSGSAGAGTKRIMFVTNGDDPFWDACLSGLNEGAKQHELEKAGLSVHRDVNNGTAEGQIEKLRQYATQDDIAGVAISVIQADNSAIVEEMRNLQEKGVHVITVDGDVNRKLYRNARTYYVGTDNIVGGRALGTAAKALLEAKEVKSGGYVQFAGFTDNDNARSRMDGVQAMIGTAYEEFSREADDMNLQRARDNVRNAILNRGDKLVALIGIWAYNAPAIADVVSETKTRDKLVVATFDAQAGAIVDMEQGRIDVMVVQNPFDMGVQTCRIMKAMIAHDEATLKQLFPNQGQPDGDIYTTGLRVVVPSDKSPVKPGLFDPKVVEYMLLPDFRAWLNKYKLQSS
ncbi:MAG TPA: substrate-binding domain-containing protein [Pirellulaceae bacterium]|nr:substrate-binding domain-containing protein [Pirellulaceae bacterium]